jgi:hypothetical protein
MLGQVRPDKVMLYQVRSGYIVLGHFRQGYAIFVTFGQVRSGLDGICQVICGNVMLY